MKANRFLENVLQKMKTGKKDGPGPVMDRQMNIKMTERMNTPFHRVKKCPIYGKGCKTSAFGNNTRNSMNALNSEKQTP